MKGILHKKINGSWAVLVKSEEPPTCSTITEHGEEYALHPDDVNVMPFRGQLLNDQHIMDGKEVEFVDVWDNGIRCAKLKDISQQNDENGKPITYWGGKQNDVKGGELETFENNDVREDDVENHVPDVRKMVEDDVERLIDFQIYLHTNNLITNHDWDFEKIAKKYIKEIKQHKS